jgi:lipopolysaccharide export system ATP-binding protein
MDKTYLMFEGGILKAGVPEELVEDETSRILRTNFELRRRNWSFKYHPAPTKDGRDSM